MLKLGDPEETPYLSKYKAREILQTTKTQLLSHQVVAQVSRELTACDIAVRDF